MDPVRLAVIGCGRIAQVAHLPALEKADGIDLVAVSDPTLEVAQAIARRYDIPHAYDDQSKVLEDPTIEAVLIAAPDRFHLAIATAALQAGKHVLVEKPLASTVEEAEALVKLVEESGLVLQVASMKRHDQGIEYAREFIATQLGEVRSFHAWYRIGDLRPGVEATHFPKVYQSAAVAKTELGFKGDRTRYSLATHGSHIFDTVRGLLGPIVEVRAINRVDGRDNTWQILATTASGAVGTISIAVDVPGHAAEGIEVFGSEGTVRADIQFPFFRKPTTVEAYAHGMTLVSNLTDGDAYERQAEAFARTIREQRQPVPNVIDGLAAVQVIAAVAQSCTTGQAVRP